ncbi:hypothetical protein [Burkholderia sp. WSM2230]|uniref:hypothetical protein n=1 Tax=Burkholderia sp. WSM2230 TaxID=944435 RepID=UPI0004022003|nr:hypothetical protein [Burkholderia sp. WSM2230]
MNKIYHRENSEVDLIAEDFDKHFIVRKLCGNTAVKLYATLRVTGHDSQSSFLAAFRLQFFGHPDAIALAAERFETTRLYSRAMEDATEALGAERIAKELSARCDESAHFTQSHAMHYRVELQEFLHGKPKFDIEPGIINSDDESYREFGTKRRKEREKAAREALVANGFGTVSEDDE